MAATREAEGAPVTAVPATLTDVPPRSRLRRLFGRVPWRIVGPVLSVGLFVGALAVLANILHEVSPDDVVAAFTTTSSTAIALSIAFTFASYLALTGYDGLALRQIGAENVPYSTAAIGSFTSYAISYTLGLPLLTAGTVRYRVYGGAGLTAPQIAALTLVCTLTFWLGMGAVLALGLIFVPAAVGQIDRLPDTLNMAIGAAILTVIAAYVLYVATRRRVVTVEGWSLRLPGGRVTIIQILLGVRRRLRRRRRALRPPARRGVDALRHLRGDLRAGRRARRRLPRARRHRRLRGDDAGRASGSSRGTSCSARSSSTV